jgi:hypothetical protein
VSQPQQVPGSLRAPDPPRAVEPPPASRLPPARDRSDSQQLPPELAAAPAVDDRDLGVSALINSFLDAAEDGEARAQDGRPYNDDELAQLEWALIGYVDSHIGQLAVRSIRGRHVFRLIDELDDAAMPRPQLVSVIESIRQLFTYAADRDLVRVNPVKYVSVPTDEREPLQRLPETNETREAPVRAHSAAFDNVVSEQTIWLLVKIVVLVFICIALVLVAESF